MSQLYQRRLPGGTARARRAGLAKAEPGAGSAGLGAAQRRRLDPIRLNSATDRFGALSWRSGARFPGGVAGLAKSIYTIALARACSVVPCC